MKEFTINCSACGQPILASKDGEGRLMNRPSCPRASASQPSPPTSARTRPRPFGNDGLLTLENISEMIMVNAALEGGLSEKGVNAAV